MSQNAWKVLVLGRFRVNTERSHFHDFARDCIAMATNAPMNMAGNSWPTIASAIVNDRAYGFNTLISLPTVVSVPKLKYVSFAVI
jgi:hypothetical protein